MILSHVKGTFFHPAEEWAEIRNEHISAVKCFLENALILAAIPAVCAYIGATLVGWDIGERSFKFTIESTIPLIICFYLASLAAVAILAKSIQWMAATYGTKQELSICVSLATSIATPLFLCGIFALAPVPWLIFLSGLCAISYSVYLLYTGIPIVMNINQEKGFLFSSAVLTIALVTVVGILVATVSLWSLGLAPVHA